MGRIIVPGLGVVIEPNDMAARIRENNEMMYALRHRKDGLIFIGNVKAEHYRGGRRLSGGWEPTCNIFTTEGLAWLVNILFHDISKPSIPGTGVPATVSPTSIFYTFVFKGNVTPVAGDTAAARLGAAGTYQECQDADYDDPITNRPSWVTVDSADGVITNAASKAHFVFAAALTVYGAGLTTTAPKTDVSGKLACAKRFATPRSVIDNDEIDVTYQITATSS